MYVASEFKASEGELLHPLVSIVIPCYNHGHYLAASIESVLEQSYPHKEILVVNDGSADDSEKIAEGFVMVRYISQENQGLAAARNTGIRHARGSLIVFLDADDLLLPGALEMQAAIMLSKKELAFVSGGHLTADKNLQNRKTISPQVYSDHYRNLLQRNYIGMHAAVMYRTTMIRKYFFDTSLLACEDYDLYLRIAAQNPVLSHDKPIAIYRSSANAMSSNLNLMLCQALIALKKQEKLLKNHEDRKAYKYGLRNWVNFYSYHGYGLLKNPVLKSDHKSRKNLLAMLWKYKRKLYLKHYLLKLSLLKS